MSWKPKCIIRNKLTGKPMLVLHSYKAATIMVDLESGNNPSVALVLLERDYDHWVDETRMHAKVNKSKFGEDNLIWKLA